MIGQRYWSTGIVIAQIDLGWHVTLEFFDDGFCNQKSTQGTLVCRYVCDDLTASIDTLKADADSLGITWKDPTVYYQGDGEWKDYSPPEGWRELTDGHARRLGWRPCYRSVEV